MLKPKGLLFNGARFMSQSFPKELLCSAQVVQQPPSIKSRYLINPILSGGKPFSSDLFHEVEEKKDPKPDLVHRVQEEIHPFEKVKSNLLNRSSINNIEQKIKGYKEIYDTANEVLDSKGFTAVFNQYHMDGSYAEVMALIDDVNYDDDIEVNAEKLCASLCATDEYDYNYDVSHRCYWGKVDDAFELCKQGLVRKCYMDVETIQGLIKELMINFRVEDAREILKLARSVSDVYLDLEDPVSDSE